MKTYRSRSVSAQPVDIAAALSAKMRERCPRNLDRADEVGLDLVGMRAIASSDGPGMTKGDEVSISSQSYRAVNQVAQRPVCRILQTGRCCSMFSLTLRTGAGRRRVRRSRRLRWSAHGRLLTPRSSGRLHILLEYVAPRNGEWHHHNAHENIDQRFLGVRT